MNHGASDAGAVALVFWMFAIYGMVFLVMMACTVLWIVELVDCVRRQFHDPNEKIVWVLVIALTHFIGALIYLCVGRHKGWLPGEAPPKGYYPPPPPAAGPSGHG